MSQKFFCDEINKFMSYKKVKQPQIVSYENDEYLPGSDVLQGIKKAFPDLNIDWLMEGEGEMISKNINEITPKSEVKKAVNYDTVNESGANTYLTSLRYYDIDATASNIETFFDSPENISGYITLVDFKDCDFACNVYGNSMSPSLNSGDIIICKKVTDYTFFEYGEIYLIVTKKQRMVKIIRKSENEGMLKIVSANPDFDSFELKATDIIGLYLVKGRIERKSA